MRKLFCRLRWKIITETMIIIKGK